MKWYSTVMAKMMARSIVVLLLAILVVEYVVYKKSSGEIIALTKERQQRTTSLYAERFDQVFLGIAVDLQTIEDLPSLSGYLQNRRYDLLQEADQEIAHIGVFLARLYEGNPSYSKIAIIDSMGEEVLSLHKGEPRFHPSTRSLAPLSGEDRDRPAPSSNQLKLTKEEHAGEGSAEVLRFQQPMVIEGEHWGQLVLEYDFATLFEGLQKERFFSTGHLAVFATDGRVVFDPIRASMEPGLSEAILKAGTSVTQVVEFEDSPPCLISTSPMQRVPWLVVAIVPETEMFQGVNETRNMIIGLVCVAFLLELLAVFLFTHRIIITPLQRILDGIRDIDEGDHSGRIDLESGDEFGRVARAFNSMVEELLSQESDLEESQALFDAISDSTPTLIYVKDVKGRFLQVNRRFEEISGLSNEEVRGKTDHDIAPAMYADRIRENDLIAIKRGEPVDFEEISDGPNGPHIYLSVKCPLKHSDGEVYALCGISTDITERKRSEREQRRLEANFQQAQKLESLGMLAGGIAHDFNNLLMAVLANAEILCADLPADSPEHEAAADIESAARYAAELSRQMLAYSGRGKFVVEPVNLNEIVHEIEQFLRASFPKNVSLDSTLVEDLPLINADQAQIQQVVLNLLSNASEAYGDAGGVITVETGCMHCDRNSLKSSFLDDELSEGDYVFFRVSDTGVGMDEKTLARIFDPFFTTKFTGRGLGLAALLGIVRGHKGAIKVDSEPGRGTEICVFFPALDAGVFVARSEERNALDWKGSGTVLLVDDEEAVRRSTKRILERFGISVLTACDGVEALEVFRVDPDAVDAVLLDLTMPRMDGEETFDELRKIRSAVPVLISSGYSDQEIEDRFSGKTVDGFLQKPFRISELKEALARVLSDKGQA